MARSWNVLGIGAAVLLAAAGCSDRGSGESGQRTGPQTGAGAPQRGEDPGGSAGTTGGLGGASSRTPGQMGGPGGEDATSASEPGAPDGQSGQTGTGSTGAAEPEKTESGTEK